MNHSRIPQALLRLCFFLLSLTAYGQSATRIPLVHSGEVIREGIDLYDKEDYKGAIAKFLQVSRNDTAYENAQYELGLAYLAADSAEACIRTSKKALDRDSQDAMNFCLLLANAYDQAGKFDKAVETYSEGIRRYPLNYKFHFELGIAYANHDNDTAAARCFEKSILMNPLHAGSHLQLGNLAARNNHFTEALLSLQFFLLIENKSTRSFNTLATIENIGKGDFKVNPDSVSDVTNGSSNFETVEQIIRSKSALRPEYKTKIKLSYLSLVKTLQVMSEQLAFTPGDNNFWMKTYVPFFLDLRKEGYFEPFIYHIFAGINDEEAQKEVAKNKSKIADMIDWASQYIVDHCAKETATLNGKEIILSPRYYDNGQLKSMGLYDEKMKINKGDFRFYHRTGAVKSEGRYNDKGEQTGTWKYYYENGHLKEISQIKDGILSGPFAFYYRNGQVSSQGTFVNNEIDGLIEYFHATGVPKSKQQFKAGVNEGKATYYHENGKVKSEMTFKNGLYDGPYREYYENGNLQAEYAFVNGKKSGHYVKYYDNGQTEKEGNLVNDESDGVWTYYFRSGKLRQSGKFKNDKETGPWKVYYESGHVETEYTASSGSITGNYIFYDKDGLKHGLNVYNNGMVKKYEYYDKSGKVISHGEESGGALNFSAYYPDGKTKSSSGRFVKGKRDGPWVYYHPTGKISQEENYLDDNLEGERKSYFTNGALREISNYSKGSLDGYYASYFKNGKKDVEVWYENDERTGEWYSYYKDGALSEKRYYLAGEISGFVEYYDAAGRLDYESYFDADDLIASVTGYDTSGNMLYTRKLEKGSGEFTSLHLDRKTKIKANFLNGSKNGKSELFYPNGKTASVFNYSGGNLHGPYFQYDVNGKITEEGMYEDGVQDSLEINYYDNGKMKSEYHYDNGSLQGKFSAYFENGSLRKEGNYDDGNLDGYVVYFARSGEVRFRLKYDAGYLVGYSYKDKSNNYVDDITLPNSSGNIVAYYANGNKSTEMTIRDNYFEGKLTYYYPNGKLQDEDFYVADENAGESKAYFENGQLKEVELYTDGSQNGLSKYYNEKGILIRSESYRNNDKHGETRYFDEVSGKMKKKILYVNDVPYSL